jgi:hypothetical protein
VQEVAEREGEGEDVCGVGGRKMVSFGGGAGGSGSGAGTGTGTGEVSLRELRCAGELSVRVRRAGW